tara:strand:- start:2415 stop:3326 length:912 start_codon:yes stop_codon:yes gene_type:complete
MFKGVTLLLLIDLCEALPKTTKQGGELYTRHHTGLHDLILDRTGIYWDPGQLSRTKKELIKSGVLRASADGDLEIIYDAFVKPGLYSERKERERLAKEVKASPAEAVTPVPRRSEAKALGESTETVIAVKKEDVAPKREKLLADHAHANSEAKRRAKRYGQKRLQDEIRRDEHRGGDRSYAAWEERQREEMEAFKRSIQEPKPVSEDPPSLPNQDLETESIVMRVRREQEENPTLHMSWSERLEYNREQKKKAAIAEAAKPFMSGLFDHPEEEEDEASIPLHALDSDDDWSGEPVDVDDGEMW